MHTVQVTLSLTCTPMCLSSLNQKTGPKQSASESCDLLNVGALPQMVYRHKNSDIDQPKRVLIDCWAQETLNQAIDQLPKRLMMVIKVNGAHVELRLD